MAGSRRVRYCDVHTVFEYIKHRRHKISRVQCDCLPGLKVDLKTVFFTDILYGFNKQSAIVVGARYVVSAAHIQPLYLPEELAEFAFHRRQRFNKRVRVLFAERMEM